MKKHLIITFLIAIGLFILSCSSPKYFYDESSYERQKELQSQRCSNVFCDVLLGIGSVFFAVATETEVAYVPSEQQFKKLNLVNPGNDTIYVNMLTDLVWDKDNYCDFMDIRIPPHVTCNVLVPVNANYNLYFSNTPQKI